MTDIAESAEPTEPVARSRPTHREHALQTQIKIWVGECVERPYLFLAFDRSRNYDGRQHLWESMRGIVRGTPDTVLLVPGLPSLWCELKAPGNKPNEAQIDVSRRIVAAGHHWVWATSVASYHRELEQLGVKFHANAALVAEHRDRLLASIEMKRGSKPRAAAKATGPRPSLARIRKAEAVRAKVVF